MKSPLSIIIEQQKKIYTEHMKYLPRKTDKLLNLKKTLVRLKNKHRFEEE
jgi:hypothetical protein